MTEKRRFRRFRVYMNIFYNELNNISPKTSYYLKNLSRDGLGLYGERLLEKGSIVELQINIPGDDEPVDAVGEVIWSRKKNEYCNEAGMQFRTIKNEDRFRLLDYGYSAWLRTNKLVKT